MKKKAEEPTSPEAPAGEPGTASATNLLKRMRAVKQRARKRAPGRPTARQSDQLRDGLIHAALNVFIDRGFEGASIEAIARDAKVAKITIYRQFEDKAGLFRAVARYAQTNVQTRLQAFTSVDGDPRVVLRGLIHRLFEAHTEPDYLAVLRMTIAESPRFPEIAESMLGSTTFALGPLIQYLERLKAQGVISTDNPRDSAVQLAAVAMGGVRYLIRRPSSEPEARKYWVESIYTTFARAWGLEPVPLPPVRLPSGGVVNAEDATSASPPAGPPIATA